MFRVLLFLSLLWCVEGFAAPTLNSHLEGAGTYGTGSASKTFSHTVAAGSNTVLYVAAFSDQVISGITYNAVSMTKVVEVALDGGASATFRLVAPATGANDVVITLAGSGTVMAQALAFDGVDQTTPEDGTIQGYYGGGSPISQSISSAAGDVGVLILGDRGGDTHNTFGGSGGATLIGGTNQSNWIIASSYLLSAGATVSPGITFSGGGTNSPEYMGFNLNAAAGAASGLLLRRRRN